MLDEASVFSQSIARDHNDQSQEYTCELLDRSITHAASTHFNTIQVGNPEDTVEGSCKTPLELPPTPAPEVCVKLCGTNRKVSYLDNLP